MNHLLEYGIGRMGYQQGNIKIQYLCGLIISYLGNNMILLNGDLLNFMETVVLIGTTWLSSWVIIKTSFHIYGLLLCTLIL